MPGKIGRALDSRGAKISRAQKKDGSPGGYMYVPADLYRLVPADARFVCELTDEGVLFRRVSGDRSLPDWTVQP